MSLEFVLYSSNIVSGRFQIAFFKVLVLLLESRTTNKKLSLKYLNILFLQNKLMSVKFSKFHSVKFLLSTEH